MTYDVSCSLWSRYDLDVVRQHDAVALCSVENRQKFYSHRTVKSQKCADMIINFLMYRCKNLSAVFAPHHGGETLGTDTSPYVGLESNNDSCLAMIA